MLTDLRFRAARQAQFHLRIPFWLASLLMMAAVSALTYLPLVGKLGLYLDDWYLVYTGYTQGIERFWEVYLVDRPLRAVLVGFYYLVFGERAIYYHLNAWLLHLASAYTLLWILCLLWPRQRLAASLMALIFLVYPGFLDQVNAFDYQSHLTSLFLYLLSIALSLSAVTSTKLRVKIPAIIFSIALGLFALGLMEYYIGLEGFRFFAIALLVFRSPAKSTVQKLRDILIRWLPFTAAPGLFLVWRLLFFESERYATNIGSLASGIVASPALRIPWMAVRLLQDTLNTYLFAFAVPVYQIVFQLRLRDTLLALLFAGLAAGIVRLWTLWPQDREEADSSIWRKEALLLGLCSSTVALFPVHFGDRHVAFAGYSRFTWTPAIGAAIVLVALLFYLSSRQIRSALLVLLILLSSATHFGNATRAAQETETLRRFWWQVTWRAPGIQKGTTLIVHYAATGISEDYVIWGPANLIYYPEQKNASPIPLSLQAEIMNENTVLKILSAKGSEQAVSRGVLENKDFSNILLISQPTRGSCVQVLDGLHPELSSKERNDFMLVAPYSNISNIITEGNSPIPPPEIFGPEPAHEWCYYFEKAQLARQRGDWQEVARLGDEALEKKLNSDDWVEWLVFLQAYAHQDRHDRLRSLAPTINEDRFLKKQVCDSLNKDGSFFQSVSPESQTLLDELFCQ